MENLGKYKGPVKARFQRSLENMRKRESDGHVTPDPPKLEPAKPLLRASQKTSPSQSTTRSKGPLTMRQFMPVPKALDDLVLAVLAVSRGAGNALGAVLIDLVSHTNGERADVLVSDGGIAKRRRINRGSAAAGVRWLRELNVLRKETPTPGRTQELEKAFGCRFTDRHRYLVWNDPFVWRLPRSREQYLEFVEMWRGYTGTKPKVASLEVVQ